MGEESQCTPNSVVEDLIYQLLYKLGIRRTTLYEEVEVIFDKITEGEVRGTREIREIRKHTFPILGLLYSLLRHQETLQGIEQGGRGGRPIRLREGRDAR